MQKVLSPDVWRTIGPRARKASRRKAAIAYVTSDLIRFRSGDSLVVDASEGAIRSGQTDAKLLRRLLKSGVALYNHPSLHAKVLVFDEVAVVGSGNMSDSSANNLIEASIVTDHPSTVSGASSLIEQLIQASTELTERYVDRLCKIRVERHGSAPHGRRRGRTSLRPLGTRTWLIGIWRLARGLVRKEHRRLEEGKLLLRKRRQKPTEEFGSIRIGGTGRFDRLCREGDSVIRIWRESRESRPTRVFRSTGILLKQKAGKGWLLLHAKASGRHSEMRWGQFQKLMKRLGMDRPLTANSSLLLDDELADALGRAWTASAR